MVWEWRDRAVSIRRSALRPCSDTRGLGSTPSFEDFVGSTHPAAALKTEPGEVEGRWFAGMSSSPVGGDAFQALYEQHARSVRPVVCGVG